MRALLPLDLDVPAGSVFGLLGPNGAGKTTLLRLLVGLRRPDRGDAVVAGASVTRDATSVCRRVGYLDQEPRFYPWMSGSELLRFAGALFGLRGRVLDAAVDRAVEVGGLAAFVTRRISGYSGGMRQRLGIAQAVIHEPRVLLLDEPLSALDPEGRHDVLEVLARLRGTTTVLFSTHILADIERICDRVAILRSGALLAESEIGTLLDRFAAPVYEVVPADAGPELDEVLRRARGRPWLLGVERTGAMLRLRTTGAADAGVELLALLAEARCGVERFERVRPSLEEVFLAVVGGHAPETGA